MKTKTIVLIHGMFMNPLCWEKWVPYYEAKGYYRPQSDCVMFTRDQVGFCAVCRRALQETLNLYTARP